MDIDRISIGGTEKKFLSLEVKRSMKPMNLALLGPFLLYIQLGEAERQAWEATEEQREKAKIPDDFNLSTWIHMCSVLSPWTEEPGGLQSIWLQKTWTQLRT